MRLQPKSRLLTDICFSSRRPYTSASSYWSSVVCSSDLGRNPLRVVIVLSWGCLAWFAVGLAVWRSEERRVGKDCIFRCYRVGDEKKVGVRVVVLSFLVVVHRRRRLTRMYLMWRVVAGQW